MATMLAELNDKFAPAQGELSEDVAGELQSILRLHSLSPQELFYKWESYSIKMGGENVRLDLNTAQAFKRNIQESLERESRGKLHAPNADKKLVGATPRAAKAGGDMFGMMEGVVQSPRTPMSAVSNNSAKRRSEFATPAAKASKTNAASTPGSGSADSGFHERQNAGEILQTFNEHLQPTKLVSTPYPESRIKVKANTELSKFNYKPMAMKLSAASEILDDRIDGFLNLIQQEYGLNDGDFGNPANQSTSEIVAVGRVASDAPEGKLTKNSIVLETSRRTGAGLRVPLRFDVNPERTLFPGQIIAVRGSNASGEYFSVTEILKLPLLLPAATPPYELDTVRTRLRGGVEGDNSSDLQPLNMIYSAGPYTDDSNLKFEALHALCERAIETSADAVILLGPFIDTEHPLIASGVLPLLPSSINVDPDNTTLTDMFRALISLPLQRLAQALPSISIIMVPSVRDAVSKHACWPQDRMPKKELGLPKQAVVVTNPVVLSLNECVIGISSLDALYELKREECSVTGQTSAAGQDALAGLSRHLIEQRHFFPLYPPTSRSNLGKPSIIPSYSADDKDRSFAPTGAMVDTSYLALGELHSVRPDVLITPSTLPHFVKVVESVLVINPGTLSKKRAPGTFAQMYLNAPEPPTQEQKEAGKTLTNEIWRRARVDVVKI